MSDRYRVRDRNTDKGPGKVWGENLTHAEAHKLKEKVLGERKSSTARMEPMSTPASVDAASPAKVPAKPFMNDPSLLEAKRRAQATAASAAADAQRRADAVQTKQKIDAAKVAADKAVAALDFDTGDLDPGDVDDLLGDIDQPVTAEDIEHARLSAEADAKDTSGQQTP